MASKFFQKIYLKTLTRIIIIVIHASTYQSIFPIKGNTFLFLKYYIIFPVEIMGCVATPSFSLLMLFFLIAFRIIVRQNYFFVLYALSVPYEITVLPLKITWDSEWGNQTYLMMYSTIS